MAQNTVVDNPTLVKDEFGRDSAERTVELTPQQAEAVNREVDEGKHETFDGALGYIIGRGVIEIKRVRDSAAKLREANHLKALRDQYNAMLKLKPELINDPQFVAKIVAAMGVKTNGAGNASARGK